MKLRIVILDGFVDQWRDQFTREFFLKLIQLKLEGYGAEYPYGVITLDSQDYVCVHLAICHEKANGVLEPWVAYKSISLARSRLFEQVFPPLSLAQSCKSPGHCGAIQNIIDKNEGNAENVRYCSSLTALPKIRAQKELMKSLREVICSIHVNFHKTYKTVESFLCGVSKFKIDQLFQSWGYTPIEYDGKALPPLKQVSLKGEEVVMVTLPQSGFNANALGQASSHLDLWESRIQIGNSLEIAEMHRREQQAA